MNKPQDEIIERVIRGVASKEESNMVIQWFATPEGQAYLDRYIDNDFHQIEIGAEDLYIRHEIPSEAMYEVIQRRIRRRKINRFLFRVAAIIIPLLIIAGLYIRVDSQVHLFGENEYEEIYIPKGERIRMLFQDGTRVFVNSDTRIRYPKKFGLSDRRIFVEGEAYFVVTSNPDRPFVIELDSATIRVLGTSFNVKNYKGDQKMDVTLDEGRLEVTPWTNDDYILNKGEKLEMDKRQGKCTIIREGESKSESLWQNDMISFTNTPLSELVKTLNRWYNIEFIVVDPQVYSYSYTIISRNTLLENVLQELELVAPVKFSYVNNQVIVSMK